MKRILSLLIITALIVSFLAACNAGDDVSDYTGPVFNSEQRFHSFAITPDAEVYGLLSGQPVGKYTADGELLDTYPGTEGFSKLCYSNGFLYAYDQTARAFVELDTATKNIRVINNGSDAVWWVRSMAVSGGSVYAAAVKNPDGDVSYLSDGFMDYKGKERFIEIDIESGQLTEHTGVKKPFALYLASNGTLYIYSRSENDYILYAFNTKSKKLKKDAEMNDAGYAAAFVREGNFFVYAGDRGLNAKNMKNKKVSACVNGVMLPTGYDMVFHKGNIVFADMSSKDGDNALRNVLLGKNAVTPLDGKGRPAEHRGGITIAGSSIYDAERLLEITGIMGTYERPPVEPGAYVEFLTSIMAGSSDVDIYVVKSGEDIARYAAKTGYYVPFNDSSAIRGYLNRCFGWVGESVKAPNGDTWALPIHHSVEVMFYLPENMGRFGISPEDLAYFDSYIDVLKRINPIKGEDYITYDYWGVSKYLMQYDSLCRDAGVYEYDTPLYRNLFETLYSGWRYDDSPYEVLKQKEDSNYHPVTQQDRAAVIWDPARVIFRTDLDNGYGLLSYYNENTLYMTEHPEEFPEVTELPPLYDLSGWRAMPVPRISEDVKHNYIGSYYAFVNPNSKNKELAAEYLEAVADNLLAFNRGSGPPPFNSVPFFTLKDLSDYEGYYDMSIPLFTDLYEIYRDAAVGEMAVPIESVRLEAVTTYYQPYIADYQDGKITLDQAVAARQREVDMWLYE